MRSVSEAEAQIFARLISPGSEAVPLDRATGRVLAEDLRADRDFPPFDRCTMDGIALRHAAFAAGRRRFRIEAIQAAGQPRKTLADPTACLETMTGAMLPAGADTVVRYEDLEIENGFATVQVSKIECGQNLHYQGIDRKTGDLLVPRGRRLTAAEIGIAATVGKAFLQVARLPRTAIVSTGDELVAVAETPLEHQIRVSNAHALHSLLLEKLGIAARLFHFPDDEKQLAEGLAAVLAEHEIVLLSGAVSAGKYDFVPDVLAGLGVEKHFHKVAQRPGKPFWFGSIRGGPEHSGVVFALPGNPVSVFTCACRYVLPFLKRSLGMDLPAIETALLAERVVFKPELTYFLPVKLDSARGGQLLARPVPGHGSGDLANLADADGFLELPPERAVFEAGEAFGLTRYRT